MYVELTNLPSNYLRIWEVFCKHEGQIFFKNIKMNI